VHPAGFEGQEWQAPGKTTPAVAVAITRVTSGLRQENLRDGIKVYPEDLQDGGVIMPGSFLQGEPYGLPEPAADDIAAAISTIKQACRIS